ncbi:MAG: hypothetical protein V7646_2715 [Pseudonocardia sp.]
MHNRRYGRRVGMGDDLVAFVLARLDEDEQFARLAIAKQDDAVWRSDVALVSSPRTFWIRSARDSRPIAVVQDLAGDHPDDTTGILGGSAAAHIARHDPARVLAEVAAKRQLVQRYQLCEAENERNVRLYDEWEAAGGSEFGDGAVPDDPAARLRETSPLEAEGLWLAVRYLAAVHAEHPDYRRAWKP